MKLTVNAPAKINLTLDIIGRRNDGYQMNGWMLSVPPEPAVA